MGTVHLSQEAPPTRVQVCANGVEYHLAADQTAEDFRIRVENVLRSGGGFISFHTARTRVISVLVTPATAVSICEEQISNDSEAVLTEERPFDIAFDL